MATHDYVIDNSTGANVRADINLVLQAILSNNSSSSAPSTTAAYMWWADTTNGVLKIRNSANDGWVELLQLDGTLTLEDGSESAPALGFRNDLNTGVFAGGTDKFNITAGGVERLELGSETIFNETGADVDFRIEGDTNANLFKLDAGTDNIAMAHASPTFSTGNGLHLADSFFLGLGTGNGTRPDYQIGTTAGATLDFRCGTGADTADIVINSSGQIGIGTTSPTQFIEIHGASNPAILLKDTTNDVIAYLFAEDDHATIGSASNHPLVFNINNGEVAQFETNGRFLVGSSSSKGIAGGNSKIQVQAIDSTGRISIVQNRNEASGAPFLSLAKTRGTSVNSNTLVVNGDTLGTIAFAGGDGTDVHSVAAQIVCQVDDVAASNDMPGRLVFFTTPDGSDTPAEVMRIDNDGNLLIGTTDTNLMTSGGDGDKGMVISKASGFQVKATSHHTAEFNRAGTEGGSVLFFQNGTEVGNIAVTSSATSYNTSSDYRLKENVVAISDGITRLKELKPSRFNFKADASITVDGFLAHEVTAVPEAITGTKDAVVTQALIDAGEYKEGTLNNPIYQGIDQSKLVPLLVAAVQELITKVETLEAA